ncbi:MAG: hypothetical protein IJ223_01005 [Clostridia bacterium]|nr:hypothetical protein [Clostridia bacterium]
MRVNNQKGVSLIVLVITVIVLAILATITAQELGGIINQIDKENISTDLLLIQAKAKVLKEKASFNSDDTILKGEKISEIVNNAKIEELKEKGVINTAEENYDKYYLLNKETIDELEIGIEKMGEEDFYIVNYATEEVIFPEGYKHTDGNTYYKLSEISNLE